MSFHGKAGELGLALGSLGPSDLLLIVPATCTHHLCHSSVSHLSVKPDFEESPVLS